MNDQKHIIFGIDLGTTYSCIAYVDANGKACVIPNQEHELATPSVVLFEKGACIVGDEAKNSAIVSPDHVVEMVKRHMGEPGWRFHYQGQEYTAEEISAYILRKLALDAEKTLGVPVKDVVITCPAYFGIAQREATAHAGEIAGLQVREIINEPTAAALAYVLQDGREQVVLVYDLGGGTFDIAIIAVKQHATTVVAAGGDHHLGGRDWDEAIVTYLAQQWQERTGESEDPLDTPETLQDLWLKAERAKRALTVREKTRIPVSHAGTLVKVELTRTKFAELTAPLLDRTILFTKLTMNAARKRGYLEFDQILLVGGSTRMPQVVERLTQEFHLPLRQFDPDEVVARGAALYGQRLYLRQRIRARVAEMQRQDAMAKSALSTVPRSIGPATEPLTLPAMIGSPDLPTTVLDRARAAIARSLKISEKVVKKLTAFSITNVASHSFGLVATIDNGTSLRRKVVSNLVRVNDPLPTLHTRTYGTLEAGQEVVALEIVENTEESWIVEQDAYNSQSEIGVVTLTLSPGLPEGSPIEVTFELNTQGRLRVTGRQPDSNTIIKAVFATKDSLTPGERQNARERSQQIQIL
ncbi:Hsp70 family protein [Dictyobacter aurantiacus]|uniref:Molecular chaperone DnaK n=1 Tax=Dictyobacter aurantiacus TaxID=1936993 RepID=A0A401Z9K3_9CHLR|nr:Hsp70 family protein [Dictyobacter aurantiacus]GCE03488.1 molecular chaperone DnaK [Dictyobacter aurantiacus]